MNMPLAPRRRETVPALPAGNALHGRVKLLEPRLTAGQIAGLGSLFGGGENLIATAMLGGEIVAMAPMIFSP